MRTSASAEDQVLFESPYGQIKAVQSATGKVGISREGYDYSFDYTLPVNEWVELEFKNTKDSTSLFVDGELVRDHRHRDARPAARDLHVPAGAHRLGVRGVRGVCDGRRRDLFG